MGQNGWRSNAAIKKAFPVRVNDLWGSGVVKGKSQCWWRGMGEKGREGTKAAPDACP